MHRLRLASSVVVSASVSASLLTAHAGFANAWAVLAGFIAAGVWIVFESRTRR